MGDTTDSGVGGSQVVRLIRRPREIVKCIMEERAKTLEYCAAQLETLVVARQPPSVEFLEFAMLVQKWRDYADMTRKLADA